MSSTPCKPKYPKEITPEVFADLYENLKDDIFWFCKNKGICYDDREDVLHDTMEAVWRDRDMYVRLSSGRSPATFVYLKLKTAVQQYFNERNTGRKYGNNYAAEKGKDRMQAMMQSYDKMFHGAEQTDETPYSDSLAVQYSQIQEHNGDFTEAFVILDKMPEALREYVVCKSLVDTGNKYSSEKELIKVMQEHGLPVRARDDKQSDAVTVYAYEHKLKKYLRETV